VARTLTAAEIPHVLSAANDWISDYAVGFAKLSGNGTAEDADLGGSGTLVTAGGHHAILTADHVLDNLPSRGELGLILPTRFVPRLHRAVIKAELARRVTIGDASYDSNGPDLGLLVLPQADVLKLEATKTFYNLDKRRDRMLSAPPTLDMGGWIVCGMVAEWTSDLPPEAGFSRVKIFRGISGFGVVRTERYDGERFDYLEFETKYNAAYQGPDSFKGLSGGGLWQIVLEEHDGAVTISDVLLSGVIYFQSDLLGEIRTLFCHGRRSIYEHAVKSLAGTAS